MTDESLFADALARPDAADRAAFLARACADADQRLRLDRLLAAHSDRGSFLDRPAGADHAATVDVGHPTAAFDPDGTADRRTAAVGDRVGPYKLLERIGEGGMGEVWVADQLEPIKRRVAVKLIKPGMDSRGVIARFEAERQALAVMDHPNIARVLDAGTAADGRPYFVMELVKGTPITDFCDARKLTPRQRLELFVPVCQAIQHAHLKGVIHRDVKPGNVLVALHDETPVPKVIDFGVAKAVGQQLTEKTLYTGFGALVGTPAYMAPEQAAFNQLDVDTRADVYALGVLLYELLAGSPPLERERVRKAALDEVLRLVRDEEPPRPSQRLSTSEARASIAAVRGTEPAKLSALMRGELDWIVMKALEKDRGRRYETATGFAADVQRYLSGEPVQAVPPSLGYRLKKAYLRNKGPVLAVAVVLFALVAGIAGTTAGLVEARRQAGIADGKRVEAEQAQQNERDRAEGERVAKEQATSAEGRTKLALDGADKMLDLQVEFGRRAGRKLQPAEADYLNTLAAQFEELARAGDGPAEAEAYARLASVQSHLGDVPKMERAFGDAIRLWADLAARDPERAGEHRVQVARTRQRLAKAHRFQCGPGADAKHAAVMRQVAADWQAVTDADPHNGAAYAERGRVLEELQGGYAMDQDAGETARRRREALACWERAVELLPDDRPVRDRLRASQWGVLISFRLAPPTPDRLAADVRAALAADFRAAARFGDDRPPGRVLDYTLLFGPFRREPGTWNTRPLETVLQLIDLWRSAPEAVTAGPPLLREELFRRCLAAPCRAALAESPGYKHAGGLELLLKIGEAECVGWNPHTSGGPNPPLPADRAKRSAELFAEALALARKPEHALPPSFLRLRPTSKGDLAQPPGKPVPDALPVATEEYVWFHRLGHWAPPDPAELAELRKELAARKDWTPSPLFRFRLAMAFMPDATPHDAAVPAPRLADMWTRADEQFALYRAAVSHDDDYLELAGRYSGLSLEVGNRLREKGERDAAALALDRAIGLLEEQPDRPDVSDWRWRSRCYLDRGTLRLDRGEWAAALADFRKCLAVSKADRVEWDNLQYVGMNPVAHFRSGVCLLRLGKADDAEAAFEAAVAFRRGESGQLRPLKSGKPAVPWNVVPTERDAANEYLLAGRPAPALEWARRAQATLAENRDAYDPAQARGVGYGLHVVAANAHDGLKDPAAAGAEWDAARELANADQLRELAWLSAGAYARAGRHADAAKHLDDAAGFDRLTSDDLYNLACGYSLCSAGTKVDATAAGKYRDRAAELLGRAVKAGFADVANMKVDTDLDPLRGRDDFKALLADLEKKSPPKAEK